MAKAIKFTLLGLMAAVLLFGVIIPGVQAWEQRAHLQKTVSVYSMGTAAQTGTALTTTSSSMTVINLNKDGKIIVTDTVASDDAYIMVKADSHYETINRREAVKRIIKHYEIVVGKAKTNLTNAAEADKAAARSAYNAAEDSLNAANQAKKAMNRVAFSSVIALFYNGTAPITTIAYLGIAFVLFIRPKKEQTTTQQ